MIIEYTQATSEELHNQHFYNSATMLGISKAINNNRDLQIMIGLIKAFYCIFTYRTSVVVAFSDYEDQKHLRLIRTYSFYPKKVFKITATPIDHYKCHLTFESLNDKVSFNTIKP